VGSIASKVTELGFGSQMRVTCLAPDPLGGWDVVMVLRKGEGWWCSYALDSTEVQNILDAHTSRLIDLSPYLDNGVWAVLDRRARWQPPGTGRSGGVSRPSAPGPALPMSITYNRYYLDILGNRGGAQQAILSNRRSRACRRSLP
jgi:hypothetical protein